MAVYAYLRVSTDKQDEVNQKLGVDNLAVKKSLVIDQYLNDHAKSGTVPFRKRNLGKLVDSLQKGDTLIVSELSRLSRKLYEIFQILQILTEKGVHVYSVKENFELHDDIQSKILAFAFGLSAEIERNMISERTKEALARLRAEGKSTGGAGVGIKKRINPVCEEKKEWILEQLSNGVTKVAVAKTLGVSKGTFYRWLVYSGIYTPKKMVAGSDNYYKWVRYGIFH